MAATRFEDLVSDHGASLLRVAYLLCRDGPRSQDLVQETLIKALRQDRAGRRPDQPGPYLRKMLLNEYLGCGGGGQAGRSLACHTTMAASPTASTS